MTNAQFKRFVDAGGYKADEQRWWSEEAQSTNRNKRSGAVVVWRRRFSGSNAAGDRELGMRRRLTAPGWPRGAHMATSAPARRCAAHKPSGKRRRATGRPAGQQGRGLPVARAVRQRPGEYAKSSLGQTTPLHMYPQGRRRAASMIWRATCGSGPATRKAGTKMAMPGTGQGWLMGGRRRSRQGVRRLGLRRQQSLANHISSTGFGGGRPHLAPASSGCWFLSSDFDRALCAAAGANAPAGFLN